MENESIGTLHSPVCLDERAAAAQVRSFGHSPSWVTDHLIDVASNFYFTSSMDCV